MGDRSASAISRLSALMVTAALALASCSGGSASSPGAASPPAEPTEEATAPEATQVAEDLAEPELLSAHFEEGSGPFVVTTTPELSTEVVDGTYEIRDFDPSVPAASFAELTEATEAVVVEAEVVEVSDPEWVFEVGLACTDQRGEGYRFSAFVLGGFGLRKDIGREREVLEDSPPFKFPFPDEVRSVRLVCAGSPEGAVEISASINGRTVVSFRDRSGLESFSHVGLEVDAMKPDHFARFDNVVARVPQAEISEEGP